MDVNELIKRKTFDVQEAYHIKSLSLRKDILEHQGKTKRLDEGLRDEFAALEWLFKLLDEISSED